MTSVPFNTSRALRDGVLVPFDPERLDDALAELDATCLVGGVLPVLWSRSVDRLDVVRVWGRNAG
jgi:hypothetical protein